MTALGFEKYQAKEVQLSCFNENTAGLLLYPKLGFVPFSIEERPAPGGRRSALINMTRHRP
jgi:RimJ/RimL family protein N-acetyltransferase